LERPKPSRRALLGRRACPWSQGTCPRETAAGSVSITPMRDTAEGPPLAMAPHTLTTSEGIHTADTARHRCQRQTGAPRGERACRVFSNHCPRAKPQPAPDHSPQRMVGQSSPCGIEAGATPNRRATRERACPTLDTLVPAGGTAAGSVQGDVRRAGHQRGGNSRVRDIAEGPPLSERPLFPARRR
jgi:hypothetical protein